MRPDWDDYFLNIADAVSKRSTCLRRNYGAIIGERTPAYRGGSFLFQREQHL